LRILVPAMLRSLVGALLRSHVPALRRPLFSIVAPSRSAVAAPFQKGPYLRRLLIWEQDSS